MKTVLKTPSNVSIARMASIIVRKEIARMLGPEGALNLIYIGALQKLIFPRYQTYYAAVDVGFIDLSKVHEHFSPDAWKLMNAAKLKLLAGAIRQEVDGIRKQIHGQMRLLHRNEAELATLTGQGQATLERVLLELTGEPSSRDPVAQRQQRVEQALVTVQQQQGDETQQVLRDMLDRQSAALEAIRALVRGGESALAQQVLDVLQRAELVCQEESSAT